MKAYKSYMDKITLDLALQEKIIKGEMKMPTTTTVRRNNKMLKFAGIAACVAVFAFAVFMLPGIFNNPIPNGGLGFTDPNLPSDPHTALVPPNEQQNGNNGDLTQDPIPPDFIPPVFDLHALTFNTAESMMSASLLPRPGYFDYDITEEQLNTIFPGLSAILTAEDNVYQSFSAVAFYRPDGSLEVASISESVITNDGRVLRMGIRVSEGTIPDSTMLFYDEGETIYSDVHGVQVTAFMHVATFDGRAPDSIFLRADFTLGYLNYRVTFSGDNLTEGQERITEIVNWLIVTGPVDLSVLADPIIPELRNERLTLDQARQDPDFGAFLPNVPERFEFSSASRTLDTRVNLLLVHFNHNVPWQFSHSIRWMIATPTESNLQRVVSASDRHKFDVSLYPIPWMDSVPREYRQYFQSPVFLASEISLEIVEARTRWEDADQGGTPEWRTSQFSVLFENVIVQISANGLSAEQIWEMLSEIN